VSRLLLALSSFWRAGGDECAWLRRHAAAIDALVLLAGHQLPTAEPGSLVQLLQALATMRHHPGNAWLDAHETRVLAVLPCLKPAALQGLVQGYEALERPPNEALVEAAARGAEAAATQRRAEVARLARQEAQRVRTRAVVAGQRMAAVRAAQEQRRRRQHQQPHWPQQGKQQQQQQQQQEEEEEEQQQQQ
jgi:hypothetical protein